MKSIIIVVSLLTIVGQGFYIVYLKKAYNEAQIASNHIEVIRSLHGINKIIDKNGDDYARRAIDIIQVYKMVEFKKIIENGTIKTQHKWSDLLEKVNTYNKKRNKSKNNA